MVHTGSSQWQAVATTIIELTDPLKNLIRLTVGFSGRDSPPKSEAVSRVYRS